MQVTIGGEPRTLGDFSAFKAFYAMASRDAETRRRQVSTRPPSSSAPTNRQLRRDDRAEARRQFPPLPLTRSSGMRSRTDGSRSSSGRCSRDGQPVLGPDPLGHLTDADWQRSGNVLKHPESARRTMQIAAMVPVAFKSRPRGADAAARAEP
jgi:hypothetical protein